MFVANILTIERMMNIQSQSVRAIKLPTCAGLTSDEQTVLERARGRILIFNLGGPLTFGVAKAISRQHAVLADHQVLIIDFTGVPVLGVSSSLAIEQMVVEDLGAGRTVFIVGAEGDVLERLRKLGILAKVPAEHLYTDRETAVQAAGDLLDAVPEAQQQPA